MSPLARLIALVAAVVAALGAAPPAESLRYRFDAARELEDFDPVAGTWTVSTGSLWCTSKGAREELRWRRSLSPIGALRVRLLGAGRVGISLRAGREETIVRLDRSEARVAVEAEGRTLLERAFDPPESGLPLRLAVVWTLERIELRVGDDESLKVDRPNAKASFDTLAFLSFQSQPRFDDLEVERAAATGAAPGSGALTEDERLAVERADALFAKGDAERAFDEIAGALAGHVRDQTSPPPDAALELLQRLGTSRASLRKKPPLAELAAAATVKAKDGSAELFAPLRPGWTIETPEIRRTDGTVLRLARAAPAVRIEIYRYDQKLPYWFGADPKLVNTTGGGGPTLGRARADDQEALRPGAKRTRAFGPSGLELGGETTYEFELAWPDPAEPSRERALRELFTLHRGDTWCFSIEGPAAALELAKSDVEWILATFRFRQD